MPLEGEIHDTQKGVSLLKEVTKLLINDFKIQELGHDFMGYSINHDSVLSFHHTIISHSKCLKEGLGHGYWRWNGSILVQDTSHDYLHIIERVDEDMFYAITSELVDMNIKGKLDVENLKHIHDVLSCFGREHSGDTNRKGRPLIRNKYLRRITL